MTVFKNIFPVLKKTYKSMDVRGIFVYSNNDRGWKCAFLKIYFTKLGIADIEGQYNKIFDLYKKIDKNDFKVICETKSIEELDTIFEDIENMKIRMDNLEATPMGTNWQEINSNESKLEDYVFSSPNEQIACYPNKALISNLKNYRPIDILKYCELDLDRYKITFSDLIYYLNVNDLNLYSDLLIILPIYCRQITLENQNSDKIARFEIHEKLTNDSQIHSTLRDNNGRLLENSDPIKINTIIESHNNEMISFAIPRFKTPIENKYFVCIEITHKVIGDLLKKTISGYDINNYRTMEIPDNMVESMEINEVQPGNLIDIITDIPQNSSSSNFQILDLIFTKFHRVARQIKNRHAMRTTLVIEDEYDVQDLLHSLFELYFSDIRHEENTPSLGNSSSRIDFLLNNEIGVEVKLVTKKTDKKKLFDDLLIDIPHYKKHPRCNNLFFFIYDPECLLSNTGGLITDIENQTSNDFQIKMYIQPSQ